MKIFVAGGSGYIGSAVIRELVGKGHDVTGLVRRKGRADVVEQAGAKVEVGDLLEPGGWTTALRESDLVISASRPVHAGERVAGPEARRRSYYHGQMVGNLFLAAVGSRVQGIAVTYGVQAFGSRGDSWLTETSEVNPIGYERTVAGAYWHIEKTSRKTRIPLINVFTGWVYGPGGWFENLLNGIRSRQARIVGDGSNYLSLIHVDDLARAYAALAEKTPVGERFCLVDGNPITQGELFGFLANLVRVPAPKSMEMDVFAHMAGDLAAETMVSSTRVSGDKMKKALLPELKYPSCRDGMPRLAEAGKGACGAVTAA